MQAKSDQLCTCGRMKVGIMWSEGAIAAVHGAYTWICKLCALERQIAHAEAQVAALPQMRKDYDALKQAIEVLHEHGQEI